MEVEMSLRNWLVLFAGTLAAPAAWAGNATVAPVLKTSTTLAGTPIVYPKTDTPEVTAVTIDVPPGGDIGEHMHPVPTFVYVLKGAIDIFPKGSEPRHYDAGQAYMEVVDTPHDAVNKGSVPAELLAVFVGIKGVKNLQPMQMQ
jgi:quercetin dioxygenase-like cupin family protein